MTEQAKQKQCPVVFANAEHPNLYNYCGSKQLQNNVRIDILQGKLCVVTTKTIACNDEILFDGMEIYYTIISKIIH